MFQMVPGDTDAYDTTESIMRDPNFMVRSTAGEGRPRIPNPDAAIYWLDAL